MATNGTCADYNAGIDEIVSRLFRADCPTNATQVRNLILFTDTSATTLLGPDAKLSEWLKSAMAVLSELSRTLWSRECVVSPDQLAEYALRAGKKLSEIRALTPEGLAELVSEQIERIHRRDKDRSAHLLHPT